MKKISPKGFTLIELLLVIAIIGILASIVLASLGGARDRAKEVTALAQLRQITTAATQLEIDTGKSIGGCPPGGYSGGGNEVALDVADPKMGLYMPPEYPYSYGLCSWTAQDAAHWKGPYISSPLDPWGREYWYDPDYYPRRNCPTDTDTPRGMVAAVMSAGPNGQGVPTDAYDCDDIYIVVKN